MYSLKPYLKKYFKFNCFKLCKSNSVGTLVDDSVFDPEYGPKKWRFSESETESNERAYNDMDIDSLKDHTIQPPTVNNSNVMVL